MGEQPYDTLEVEEIVPPTSPSDVFDLPEGVNNRITVYGPITKKNVACGYNTRRTVSFYNQTYMTTPWVQQFSVGCELCVN